MPSLQIWAELKQLAEPITSIHLHPFPVCGHNVTGGHARYSAPCLLCLDGLHPQVMSPDGL